MKSLCEAAESWDCFCRKRDRRCRYEVPAINSLVHRDSNFSNYEQNIWTKKIQLVIRHGFPSCVAYMKSLCEAAESWDCFCRKRDRRCRYEVPAINSFEAFVQTFKGWRDFVIWIALSFYVLQLGCKLNLFAKPQKAGNVSAETVMSIWSNLQLAAPAW